MLGQVVDFCGQALWGSQELRGRRIIVASLRRFVGIVIYAGHGWSRLVSAGLVPIAIGTARPPPLDHRDRFTFERLLARVERCALTDKKEGLTSWKKLVMSGSNRNEST